MRIQCDRFVRSQRRLAQTCLRSVLPPLNFRVVRLRRSVEPRGRSIRVRRSGAAISSLWQAYAMPAAMMRFDFPAGLPCTPDVLGLRSWVHLPPHKAELCMPVEAKREVDFAGAFAPPRLRGINWFTKVNDHFSHDEWFGWGSFHQGGPDADSRLGHIDSAVLRVDAPDVSDEGLQDIGLTINRSIYPWYLLPRDWLESLTHVDLGHEHAEGLRSGRSPVETPWWVRSTRVRGEHGYTLVNPPVTIQLRGSPHVSQGCLAARSPRDECGSPPSRTASTPARCARCRQPATRPPVHPRRCNRRRGRPNATSGGPPRQGARAFDPRHACPRYHEYLSEDSGPGRTGDLLASSSSAGRVQSSQQGDSRGAEPNHRRSTKGT